MPQTFYVSYTVYRRGSGEVISEGEMPVTTSDRYRAEQTVKAMFESAGEVITRYVRQ